MEFIKTYFTAEKNESLIFIAFGLLTISFSAYALLKWGDTFYKGFAIPVILIGIIQLVVGGSVYFRSDRQIAELEALHKKDKKGFVTVEEPRMNTVMKNFAVYKKVEALFIIVGVLLIFLASSKEFWLGIGVGMLLQGSLMLTADIFAERRGSEYIRHILEASLL